MFSSSAFWKGRHHTRGSALAAAPKSQNSCPAPAPPLLHTARPVYVACPLIGNAPRPVSSHQQHRHPYARERIPDGCVLWVNACHDACKARACRQTRNGTIKGSSSTSEVRLWWYSPQQMVHARYDAHTPWHAVCERGSCHFQPRVLDPLSQRIPCCCYVDPAQRMSAQPCLLHTAGWPLASHHPQAWRLHHRSSDRQRAGLQRTNASRSSGVQGLAAGPCCVPCCALGAELQPVPRLVHLPAGVEVLKKKGAYSGKPLVGTNSAPSSSGEPSSARASNELAPKVTTCRDRSGTSTLIGAAEENLLGLSANHYLQLWAKCLGARLLLRRRAHISQRM